MDCKKNGQYSVKKFYIFKIRCNLMMIVEDFLANFKPQLLII